MRQTALCVALLLDGCAFAAGCPARNTPAVNWRLVTQIRPLVPPRPAILEEPAPPPELQIEPSAASPLIFARYSMPPRPRTMTPTAASGVGDSEATPPAPPLISPQLSQEEQTAARQQAGQSLRVAEQNLRATLGRTLSTTQAEIAEKVRSFIAQAREAVRGGDWVRARNLAQKAELLSFDLAKTM